MKDAIDSKLFAISQKKVDYDQQNIYIYIGLGNYCNVIGYFYF